MQRRLKLLAVIAVVLVSLTGFSGKRGSGHRSHDYDGDYGGGCSTSSTRDDNEWDADAPEPHAKVVECATADHAAATVRVVAAGRVKGSTPYYVDVDFLDSKGDTVDTGRGRVTQDSSAAKGAPLGEVVVTMEHPEKVGSVKSCKVVDVY
ncbi:hypothetical protein [Streptomyces sp. NPDC017993]|uniref:hypothetical protein n=1 Tax=Streptomyces sp. NPDC017993 TaxID=3365027 RepID=UPI00379E558D